MTRYRFVPAAAAILFCLLFLGEARAGDIFSGMEPRKNNAYSLQEERINGDKDLVEFVNEYLKANKKEPFVYDAEIEKYLNGLIQRLLAGAPDYARQFEYRVRLVNQKDTNASALRGGIILIYSGVLKNATSEDYIASLLAHEIGHIALRHASARSTYEFMLVKEMELLHSELEKIKDADDPDSEKNRKLLEFLVRDCADRAEMGVARFRAAGEMEADIFGVRLSMAAGFDPLPFMKQMAEREKRSGRSSADWIKEVHLPSLVRLAMARHEMNIWIKEYPVRKEASPKEFLKIKKRAKGLFRQSAPNAANGLIPCVR